MSKSLMRLMVETPNYVRSKLLTDHQIYILDEVKSQPTGMTTAFLAELLDTSIQSASGTLYKLYQKGYLKREQKVQESGGYEYRYTFALKERL